MERRRSDLPVLRHGDHLCWTYDSDEERGATIADWIRDGIARREHIVSFLDGHSDDPFSDRNGAGVDVAALMASKQITIVDTRRFLGPAAFDPADLIENLEEMTARAVDDGWSGVRAVGEMAWVLDVQDGPERLDEYEQLVDAFIANAPFSGLCGYDTRRFAPDFIHGIGDVHPWRHGDVFDADDRAGAISCRSDRSGFVAAGDLDANTVSAVERRFRFSDPGKTLVVDMTAVTACDDSLADVFRRAGDRAASRGGQLIVIDPPPELRARADEDGRARASGLVLLRRLTDPN